MSDVEKFEVLFLPSGHKGRFAAGTHLLDAARELGVGIESICGGTGACAKCKCQVLDGTFDDEGHELSMGHMVTAATRHGMRSRESHVTAASEHEQRLARKHHFKNSERLSCQARVLGDAVVFIPEEARVRETIVRKAAGKPVAVRDLVTRKYFVTVPAPTLEDHRGDWERLRDALKAEHDVEADIDFMALKQLSDMAKPQRAKVMQLTATVWRQDPQCKGDVVRIENGDTSGTLLRAGRRPRYDDHGVLPVRHAHRRDHRHRVGDEPADQDRRRRCNEPHSGQRQSRKTAPHAESGDWRAVGTG